LLLALIVAPLALLTLCFAMELFAGISPLHWPARRQVGVPRTAIVVPAHDEAAILATKLAALREAAEGLARILVVADNCSDRTAEIARKLDVDVVERRDPGRRGKGFALDFAKRHLMKDPPDVVIIIDADCSTDASSVGELAASCAACQAPCQATNLQMALPGSSPTVKLSTFAFFIRNVIRQRGLQRLAGRVHLLGTGMALPWVQFVGAELATGNIVEDLKLGQDLAAAGHLPKLVEAATVWSEAETEANTLSQRRRWEGGFLQNAVRTGPALILTSLRKRDAGGLWAAVSLMIPPFALLLMLDIAALGVVSMLAAVAHASWLPASFLALSIVLAGTGMGLAWGAGGSRFVGLGDLARAPLYLAWKLPVYLGFARHGAPKNWQRTDRGAA
jgi:cellulose synthase/poly-beta-1,6-N-acetylglucosamine synthase-like glycosyltransferase